MNTDQRLNRRNIFDFAGFGLEVESEQFQEKVLGADEFTTDQLRAVCMLLSVDSTGDRETILQRLLIYLNDLSTLVEINRREDKEEDYMFVGVPQESNLSNHLNQYLQSCQITPNVLSGNKLHVSFEDVQSSVLAYDGSSLSTLESFIT